jgi:two-component sensor histidine kinase
VEKLIEVGIGSASADGSFAAGRAAAAGALAEIRRYAPSLTLVFASAYYDGDDLAAGVASVLGDCPMIGTSSSGEIFQHPLRRSVVVTILASPHLTVEVGVGEETSQDWLAAIRSALPTGPTAPYFRDRSKLGGPYYSKHPAAGISPVFTILFTPGKTSDRIPPNQQLHEFLKNTVAGRIPIVGGMSSTPDEAFGDFQIANGRAYRDAVVLATVETNLLFGIGVGHGYQATRKRRMVTRTQDNIIWEFDDRPAVDVYAESIGIDSEELLTDSSWFSRRPFGISDAFGNYALLVPERALPDGSIHFGWSIEGLETVTLMEPSPQSGVNATRETIQKALAIGHMKDPAAIFLFTCKSRYELDEQAPKTELDGVLWASAMAPTTGFLTGGEYGIEEDGLCIICNHSVVALAIGDDLEPRAAETRRRANTLREIEMRLARKSSEFDSLRRAGEVVFDQENWMSTTPEFEKILAELTGADSVIFHVGPGASSPPVADLEGPTPARSAKLAKTVALPLSRQDRTLGWIELCCERELESLEAAASIADLIASGIKRVTMEKIIDEQAREIDTVRSIAREILSATNYRLALSNISETILYHVKASRYSLWIGTAEGNLRLQASTLPDDQATDFELAAHALATRSMARHTSADAEFLALPLAVNENVNGALVLAFDPDEALVGEEVGFLAYLSMPLAMMVDIFNRQRESTVAREIHHRVKNNLQVIASLLSLQLRRLAEPAAKEALEDSIRRIMSISVVHEFLSGKQLERVEALGLVRDVSESVANSMRAPHQQFAVSVEGAPTLEISPRQATSLAVIVNELVGNAIKHGFRDEEKGDLSIRLANEDHVVILTVQNSPGRLPADFVLEKATGLGLQLVRSITESELSGSFSLQPAADGVEARLAFPLK